MITQKRIKTVLILATVLAVLAAFGGPLQAAAVVYESFNYVSGSELTGSGGTGFTGAWTTSEAYGVVWTINGTGLTFTGLSTAGGSAWRYSSCNGRGEANRTLSAASQNALLANDTTMWFSVLFQNSGGNAGFVIGTDVFDLTLSGNLTSMVPPAEGVGFGTEGPGTILALAYDDIDGLVKQDSGISVATVKLIVGKIEWKANGIDDIVTIYNAPEWDAPPIQIASVSADMDQSAFDLVNIMHSCDTAIFDEIRIGNSLADVGVVPDLDRPDVNAGIDKISWSGEPVQLAATVVSNDAGALTYFWSADPNDGVVFDPPGSELFYSNFEDPKVTITRDTDDATIVTLTLAANNVGATRTDTVDLMTIKLYDDACDAAVLGTPASFALGDLDEDCLTGLTDFKAISEAWDDDYTIIAPAPTPL